MGMPVLMSIFYQQGYTTKEEMDNIMIIGHRGGASLGPENTLECIRKGIEAGADMIEVDIHLTRDNHIVICHDQSINRTTNGKGLIRELSLDDIRQYRVIDDNGVMTDEHLPTLEEVMDLIQQAREGGNPCKLLIEIKRTNDIYQGIEELLWTEIKRRHATGWVFVQSFNDSVLKNLHQIAPSLRLEKLFFLKFPGLPVVIDGFNMSWFSYEKYEYVYSFNMHYLWLTDSFLDDVHNHGKEVKIWTLEGPPAPHKRVDGIITNRPDLWKGCVSPR